MGSDSSSQVSSLVTQSTSILAVSASMYSTKQGQKILLKIDSCSEHAQTLLLTLFPKQYNKMTIYMTFTLHQVLEVV